MHEFIVAGGTSGLTLDEVAHVMVPGRGRDDSAEGLSAGSRARVAHAHALYTHSNLRARNGRIVCSGYKTPTDEAGANWSPDDSENEVFRGVPEADSMCAALVALGVPSAVIRVERHSIDTATNFARSEAEGCFGDDRPVAIIAQQMHLQRILDIVAPRTLRRDYLGVVVPEAGAHDMDNWLHRLVSRYVLYGMGPENPRIAEVTAARATRVWRAAKILRRIV